VPAGFVQFDPSLTSAAGYSAAGPGNVTDLFSSTLGDLLGTLFGNESVDVSAGLRFRLGKASTTPAQTIFEQPDEHDHSAKKSLGPADAPFTAKYSNTKGLTATTSQNQQKSPAVPDAATTSILALLLGNASPPSPVPIAGNSTPAPNAMAETKAAAVSGIVQVADSSAASTAAVFSAPAGVVASTNSARDVPSAPRISSAQNKTANSGTLAVLAKSAAATKPANGAAAPQSFIQALPADSKTENAVTQPDVSRTLPESPVQEFPVKNSGDVPIRPDILSATDFTIKDRLAVTEARSSNVGDDSANLKDSANRKNDDPRAATVSVSQLIPLANGGIADVALEANQLPKTPPPSGGKQGKAVPLKAEESAPNVKVFVGTEDGGAHSASRTPSNALLGAVPVNLAATESAKPGTIITSNPAAESMTRPPNIHHDKSSSSPQHEDTKPAETKTAGDSSANATQTDPQPTLNSHAASAPIQNAPSSASHTASASSATITESPAEGKVSGATPNASRALNQSNAPGAAPPPAANANQTPPATGDVQAVRILDRDGETEVRIGIRTPAFGGIEVHTVVRESQVGLSLGSEQGDLRSFLAPEIPALQASLHQHDLSFAQIKFLNQSPNLSGGFQDGSGSQSGSYQQEQPKTSRGFHFNLDSDSLFEQEASSLDSTISVHA
jgi:hypothetical protein